MDGPVTIFLTKLALDLDAVRDSVPGAGSVCLLKFFSHLCSLTLVAVQIRQSRTKRSISQQGCRR